MEIVFNTLILYSLHMNLIDHLVSLTSACLYEKLIGDVER